jgi:hypothetical protein
MMELASLLWRVIASANKMKEHAAQLVILTMVWLTQYNKMFATTQIPD